MPGGSARCHFTSMGLSACQEFTPRGRWHPANHGRRRKSEAETYRRGRVRMVPTHL